MYKQLATPRLLGWRIYLLFGTMSLLNLGVNVYVYPFSGEEDSDISVRLNLPGFEISLGVDNNPW